ncbi:MAG: thioredoxin family protein [Fusobacterium sp.]|uniref:thioredoxin family protein n=1 Tax=Fusobacterium sp. TaxID=68766 RepID=UPI0039944224
MGIFDKLFGSKERCCGEEVEKNSCSCNGGCSSSTAGAIEVRIIGSGCKNCQTLEKNTLEAISELGLKAEVKHITDFAEIATYGIMSTPGLWINGKIVSYGKVLSKDEVKVILEKI